MEEKDIFDKIMELPLLNIFEPIYKKYKMPLLYIFFGCITTLCNFIAFYVFHSLLKMNELISNGLAWVVALIVAFTTNRTFVFESDDAKIKSEFIKFTSGRIFSLFVEEAIMFVLVTLLHYNAMVVKVIESIITAFINYFIGKLIVFKKNGKEK